MPATGLAAPARTLVTVRAIVPVAGMPPRRERLLQQVPPFRQVQQVTDLPAGGKLRLRHQHLRAPEHHRFHPARRAEELLAFLDEDVEQLALVLAALRVAEPLAGRGADLLQGEAAQPLVERLRHPLHQLRRQRLAHLHEDGAHRPALEVEHQQQPLARHRHQVQLLEHHPVERRRHRHAELLRQHAEHLGGALEDLLHGRAPRLQFGIQQLPVLARGRRVAQHVVH
ncbi:MAG TPA: hypothetical protein PLL72_06470, partial [Burkholderiaceae bacterium]|nr:hypothetical protein [Burkholderiaceae bacterium]